MSWFTAGAAIAARQYGFVTHAQLLSVGGSGSQIRRAVQSARLERHGKAVFRYPGSALSWHARVMLAVIATGPLAVASFRTAAALWGFDRYRQGPIEVLCPRWARCHERPVLIHETRELPTRDLTLHLGIPTTAPTRTLIDLGRYLPASRLGQMMDDAVRLKMTSYEELHLRLAELSRPGRAGIGRSRLALSTRGVHCVVPDSSLEELALRILRGAEIPEPVVHHPIHVEDQLFVVDIAWPEARLALECDGFLFHSGPEQLRLDHHRQNLLATAGWTLLRTDWHTLRTDASQLIGQIATALANTPTALADTPTALAPVSDGMRRLPAPKI